MPVSGWLFFVPSCLRGLFERIAAQKTDGHPLGPISPKNEKFNFSEKLNF